MGAFVLFAIGVVMVAPIDVGKAGRSLPAAWATAGTSVRRIQPFVRPARLAGIRGDE